MWWMLAGVAIQAAQGIGAAKGQAALDKIQNKQVQAYNTALAQQTARSFNEIAIEKTVLAEQTAQALVDTGRQGLQLSAQRGLQAAGTDTMGASVEQNLADVDQKVADAQYMIGYNEQITDMSLNAAIQQAADTGAFSVRTEGVTTNTWGTALGNAAANGAMMLFENKARTGNFSGYTVSRNNGVT